MSRELKMFFIALSNSFRPDGYGHIVDQPKRMGELSSRLNSKLNKKYKKINRESDEQFARIKAY